MKKYINLGFGLGLVIATTSAFGFSLSATIDPKTYYCNGKNFSITSCFTTLPSDFTPNVAVFSQAVVNALAAYYPNNSVTPMVARLAASKEAESPTQLWYTNNAANPSNSSSQLLISIPNNPTVVLKGGTAGNPTTITLTAYYVPCGTTFPAEASPSGSVTGSTQITSTGLSLLNTTMSCQNGGSIYFALAPNSLVNGFIPGDTYSGDITFLVEAK